MKVNYLGNDGSKSRLLHIPVPWVYVIAYLVGIVIQFVYPISISSTLILALTRILGGVILVVGVAIVVWAQLIFHKEHTTTDPNPNFFEIDNLETLPVYPQSNVSRSIPDFYWHRRYCDVCLVASSHASGIVLCQLDSDSSRGEATEESFWENL